MNLLYIYTITANLLLIKIALQLGISVTEYDLPVFFITFVLFSKVITVNFKKNDLLLYFWDT